MLAAACYRPNPLDAEPEVRTGPLDRYPVGTIHQRLECLHPRNHPSVIEGADPEKKLRERLRAHLGLLGH